MAELVLTLWSVGFPMWYQMDGDRTGAGSEVYPHRNWLLVVWLFGVAALVTRFSYLRLEARQQVAAELAARSRRRFSGVQVAAPNLPRAGISGDTEPLNYDPPEPPADLTAYQLDLNALVSQLTKRPLPPLPESEGESVATQEREADQTAWLIGDPPGAGGDRTEIDLREGRDDRQYLPTDHHVVLHVFLTDGRAASVLPPYLGAKSGPTQAELLQLAQTLRLREVLEWETGDGYLPVVDGGLAKLFPIREDAEVHLWHAPLHRPGARQPHGVLSILGPVPKGGAPEPLIQGVDALLRSIAEILNDQVWGYHFMASRTAGVNAVDMAEVLIDEQASRVTDQ